MSIELHGVFVLCTTNRPDIVDRALLRPGRLEKNTYALVPDADARGEIFRVNTRDMPLAAGVDLDAFAEDGYTGGPSSPPTVGNDRRTVFRSRIPAFSSRIDLNVRTASLSG